MQKNIEKTHDSASSVSAVRVKWNGLEGDYMPNKQTNRDAHEEWAGTLEDQAREYMTARRMPPKTAIKGMLMAREDVWPMMADFAREAVRKSEIRIANDLELDIGNGCVLADYITYLREKAAGGE